MPKALIIITFASLCAVIGILIGILYFRAPLPKSKVDIHPIPVVTKKTKQDNFKIYSTALGTVTPIKHVIVTPQIDGKLIKVAFKEGQNVKPDDLLAQIDDRSYVATLLQYEGQLNRDLALLENAKIDLARYETLWKQNSISKQILDTQLAQVAQYEGSIQLDKGLVEASKVNLSHCTITSTIDGQVGLRLVDEGNYIQAASNSGIAVINSLDPINVTFSLTSNILPKLIQKINQNETLIVEVYDSELNNLLAAGSLAAIDNQIDQSTGTIKLKAQFDNKNNTLFPNQFVNVKLLLDVLEDVTIIPYAAVQYDTNGSFIYQTTDENKVKITRIDIIRSDGDDAIISNKLAPDSEVVVQGVDKLTDGVTISKASGSNNP